MDNEKNQERLEAYGKWFRQLLQNPKKYEETLQEAEKKYRPALQKYIDATLRMAKKHNEPKERTNLKIVTYFLLKAFMEQWILEHPEEK